VFATPMVRLKKQTKAAPDPRRTAVYDGAGPILDGGGLRVPLPKKSKENWGSLGFGGGVKKAVRDLRGCEGLVWGIEGLDEIRDFQEFEKMKKDMEI